MNAAARAMNDGMIMSSSPVIMRDFIFSRSCIFMMILALSCIMSGLGLITLADNTRIAVGHLISLQQTRDNLHNTYGQLLLEENTWSAPERVVILAQQNLAMIQIEPQKVIILKS